MGNNRVSKYPKFKYLDRQVKKDKEGVSISQNVIIILQQGDTPKTETVNCKVFYNGDVKFEGEPYVIPKEFFFNINEIEEISDIRMTIPNSVVVIDEDAFCVCKNITRIDLPSELRIIGNGAFSMCGVNSVDLSNCKNIKAFGSKVFSSCNSLTKIIFPECIDTIPEGCCEGCKKLEYADIKNVNTIGNKAFSNCMELSNLTISQNKDGLHENNRLTIRKYAFYNCSKLRSIEGGKGLKSVNIGAAALIGCPLDLGNNIDGINEDTVLRPYCKPTRNEDPIKLTDINALIDPKILPPDMYNKYFDLLNKAAYKIVEALINSEKNELETK